MITINSPRGDSPIQVPTRADGRAYRFELIHAAGALRTYAESLTELVGALIPGYLDTDAAGGDALRLRYAVDTQVWLQAELCAAGDLDACSDADRRVLLGDRHVPPEVTGDWSAPVPLVLVDTYYEPYGRRPRPGGNVVWLSPRDEAAFLRSLAATGAVTLAEREGPPPGPGPGGPKRP